MTWGDKHPDLDTLLAFATGGLERSSREGVAAHVESCQLCRLELDRFQQFEDPVVPAESDWDEAEKELEGRWPEIRDKAFPEVGLDPGMKRRPFRGLNRKLWWAPVAAAAVLAVVILGPFSTPTQDPGRAQVWRGSEAGNSILLETPTGEIPRAPEMFVWSSEDSCSWFTLEIFTPELERVFSLSGIENTTWPATPSLIASLKPGEDYLWAVQGVSESRATVRSSNGWFRISADP